MMETFRELLSLGRENWPFLKDVLSIVGAVAAVLGGLTTLTGIRRRRAERRALRKEVRDAALTLRRLEDRDRAEWFAYLYRHKRDKWGPDAVEKMTVQQACGYMGEDLPEWAKEGWERVLVGDLNKPVRKS